VSLLHGLLQRYISPIYRSYILLKTGVMKPTVVFFGENVPLPIVERAMDATRQAKRMLVVGTSLSVYSSWRFVAAAHSVCISNAIT